MIKFEINTDTAETGKIVLNKLQAALADTPEFNIDRPASDRLGVVYRPQEDKVVVMLGWPAMEPNKDIYLGINLGSDSLPSETDDSQQLKLPLEETSDQLNLPF